MRARTLLAALLLPAACAADLTTDGDELPVVVERETVMTMNAMTMNALSMNHLVLSGKLEAMTLNGLTAAALVSRPGVPEALSDPDARMFLQYMVSCALPRSERIELEIDGSVFGFQGELALAPEWSGSEGSCGPSCRGWVSACMLARVNARGEHVPLSVRGEHPGLRVDRHEMKDFGAFEGAYFGDVFNPLQELLACTSDGKPAARVCGSGAEADSCVIDTIGTCQDVCNHPARQRSYGTCDDKTEVVTVYLEN